MNDKHSIADFTRMSGFADALERLLPVPIPERPGRALVPMPDWYRIEDRRYSVADEMGDHAYTRHEVVLLTFNVASYTPKGVWLRQYFSKRWVSYTATRRFACPTVALALESYLARKKKQAAIYQARADNARRNAETALRQFGKAFDNG
jgi:hypothetical protein